MRPRVATTRRCSTSEEETMETFSKELFPQKLATFVEGVQAMVSKHYAAELTNLTPPVFTVTEGRRYLRVVRTETFGASRSVFCFVDKTNGDILKAATWKAPAKHARGNVFDENPLDAVTRCGAKYLR